MKNKMNIRKSIPILLLSLLCLCATTEKTKNVLIIGDSISMGYTPFVQKALEPGIVVIHNPGNGGSTVRGLDSLDVWIGSQKWDLIVFNFGLHDLVHKDEQNKYNVTGKITVPVDQYAKNLGKIVARLKKTNAKVMFVTTTVVPENSSGRKVEDPAIYNKAAKKVMHKKGIQVIDLYKVSETVHPQNSIPGNVHYTPEGYQMLAAPIIKAIQTACQ
ncbi:MAG: SGNH/GDSL hydrolase family protein [Prolixibacteraceae bacterium]